MEILLSFVLYTMLVLLPLVPAVITYRVSPDKPLLADGKIGWLTVKAGGAFAAYLITLVVSYSLGNKIMDLIEADHASRLARIEAEHAAQISPTTVLRIDVRLLDANGEPIDESLHGLEPIVRLDPAFYTTGDRSISVHVPGKPEEYGYQVEVPNYGRGYRAKHEVRKERDPNRPSGMRLVEPIDVPPDNR